MCRKSWTSSASPTSPFHRWCVPGLLLLPLLASHTALGQSDERDFHPVCPWPAELGLSLHHSSTATEGALRGQAALIHALGNYELNSSQAAILAEQARSLRFSNCRSYVELRQWNRDRLIADRQQRSQAKRRRYESLKLERYATAYRLTDEELDRRTGTVVWPKVFEKAEYDRIREELNKLFLSNAGCSNLPERAATDVKSLVVEFQRQLRTSRTRIPRSDYLAAQKFLRGLKYEDAFRRQSI